MTDKFTVIIDDGYSRHQTEFFAREGSSCSSADLVEAIKTHCTDLRHSDSYIQLGPSLCPPTPSSPQLQHTAPANYAADPAIPATAAQQVEFGQLSAEQLQRLDGCLLGRPWQLEPQTVASLLSLLWRIVRPGAMKAAGMSTCEPTPKPSNSASNASPSQS